MKLIYLLIILQIFAWSEAFSRCGCNRNNCGSNGGGSCFYGMRYNPCGCCPTCSNGILGIGRTYGEGQTCIVSPWRSINDNQCGPGYTCMQSYYPSRGYNSPSYGLGGIRAYGGITTLGGIGISGGLSTIADMGSGYGYSRNMGSGYGYSRYQSVGYCARTPYWWGGGYRK